MGAQKDILMAETNLLPRNPSITTSLAEPSAPQRYTVALNTRNPQNVQDIFDRVGIIDDLAQVEKLLLQRASSRSELITAAGSHMVRAGGKRLRAALVLLAGKLGHYQFERLLHPAASAELIHAASLVHDDLVDQTAQRRGHVTVHTRWDNDVALIVGDYFFALAAGEMALSPDPRIITFYAQAVQTIVEGELSPVTMVEPFEQALEQYIYKTGSKTASLFEAACKAGMTAGGGSDEQIQALGHFGYNVGIAFQIMDDILDFVGDERALGKPAGNDLRQNTITLPLIYAVAHGGSDELRQIVDLHHPSEEHVQRAVATVIASGGIDRARLDAQEYVQRALMYLEMFPHSEAREALVSISQFFVERQT